MNRPPKNSRIIIGLGMIGWSKGRGLRFMMPGVAMSMPITAPIGATTAMWIHSTCDVLSRAVPAICEAATSPGTRG